MTSRWKLTTRLTLIGAVAALVAAGGYALAAPATTTTVVVDDRAPASAAAPLTGADAAPIQLVDSVTAVKAPAAACPQGDHQREVEAALYRIGWYAGVTVDGRQSAADCAAIKNFQSRFGIVPVEGRAGPLTANVANRIAASMTAGERARCGAGSALTVCVDLSQQTAWAVRGGRVVWGPTVIRTGMRGYATPAGRYRIYGRALKAWSKPYKVWLPYWQPFNGGIGFHQTTTYIHNTGIGSHGCVNLLPTDAVSLWRLTPVGTQVSVFGRRPGT